MFHDSTGKLVRYPCNTTEAVHCLYDFLLAFRRTKSIIYIVLYITCNVKDDGLRSDIKDSWARNIDQVTVFVFLIILRR